LGQCLVQQSPNGFRPREIGIFLLIDPRIDRHELIRQDPPAESIVNQTLDPSGRTAGRFIQGAFSPEQIAEFKSTFIAKHLIPNEIERLMALLDALDGDEYLELNLAGFQWIEDPRLDDGECDAFENEPSFATTEAVNQDHAGWPLRTPTSPGTSAEPKFVPFAVLFIPARIRAAGLR
jgi:hypothetical protein